MNDKSLSSQLLFKFLPRKYQYGGYTNQKAKKCGILTTVTTYIKVHWDVIFVLFGVYLAIFQNVSPLNYLTVYRLILIQNLNFKCWGVNFIINTAVLMQVLLYMKFKSNGASLEQQLAALQIT